MVKLIIPPGGIKDYMNSVSEMTCEMKQAVDDHYDLCRFLDAQAPTYARGLREVSSGQKRSLWMWYVFPIAEGWDTPPHRATMPYTHARKPHVLVARHGRNDVTAAARISYAERGITYNAARNAWPPPERAVTLQRPCRRDCSSLSPPLPTIHIQPYNFQTL